MIMKNIIFAICLIVVGCQQKSPESVQIRKNQSLLSDSVARNTDVIPEELGLKILKKFKLEQISLLGDFENAQKQKIYLLKGKSKNTDNDEWHLYVVPNSKDVNALELSKFSLPGKEYDFYDTPIYMTRVFYGHCLNKFPFSIVWYQNTLMEESKKWEKDYYVLDVSSENFKAYRFKEQEIKIDEILSNLSQRKCFELPAQEVRSGP